MLDTTKRMLTTSSNGFPISTAIDLNPVLGHVVTLINSFIGDAPSNRDLLDRIDDSFCTDFINHDTCMIIFFNKSENPKSQLPRSLTAFICLIT